MSEGSRRGQVGSRRHLCAACRERKARYRYRGEVRADRQHVLCFQCFRSARERLRAWQIREGAKVNPGLNFRDGLHFRDGGTPASLTGRQIDHRRAMLAHLERQAAAAR